MPRLDGILSNIPDDIISAGLEVFGSETELKIWYHTKGRAHEKPSTLPDSQVLELLDRLAHMPKQQTYS